MAGTNLGTAWIQIKPTTKGITAAIKQEMGNTESIISGSGSKLTGAFNSLGKKAGTALKVGIAAATTGAVASVAALVKSATTQFAEYEQLVGGVETLFKDAAGGVMANAEAAFQSAGLSANEYMETVTSFSASLIQSLGGDTTKAADYADRAIVDMSDNANKMGTSMEMIQNAYQGFAKQNYTMLDNLKLGYGGTKEEMQRLLDDASKLSGLEFDISSFADITQAIHIVQEEMGITGTTAKEAESTIQGSTKMMKAAWANLVTGMGDENANLEWLIGDFIESAGSVIENIIPVIERILPNIVILIERLVPLIVETLPTLIQQLIPPAINVVIQLATAIIRNLPMILTMLLQGFLTSLPTLITAIVEAIPQLVQAVVDFFTDPTNIGLIAAAAVELFLGIVSAVPQILGSLIGAFGNLVGNLWNWITTAFSTFASNFGNFIGGIFKGAINGVISFIEGFINTPIDIINGFIDIINGAFGFVGVNLGKIDRVNLPRLATGGLVRGVGTDTSDSNLYALSRGEYVINAAAARDIGYDNLQRMNETGEISNSQMVNITINGYNKSPEELATIISRKIAFNQRGVLG